MGAEWETMWSCGDSQEVGLEAATLERVRNSSLVERDCAENATGLKPPTEARDTGGQRELPSVGAMHRPLGMVEERRVCGEGSLRRAVGAHTSENAGMSSERGVRTPSAERLRVPTEGQSTSGESGLSRG